MSLPLSLANITTDDVSPFFSNNIVVHVLRLDKIHPAISGNKWFKLGKYLHRATETGKKGLITFGGAWSNHILATAVACEMNGLESIGLIRGEEPRILSTTLEEAGKAGMKLVFLSREDYRHKLIPKAWQYDDYLLVNEGGYGKLGAEGASSILEYAVKNYSHYCCAVGTGTMMAGLINASSDEQSVTGISVLKNNIGLETSVKALITQEHPDWQLHHHYHFGGYAKHPPELIGFMNQLYAATGVPSDIVYTGKLFYAMKDLADKNYFPSGSRILLIHSGGLQGNSSLPNGTLIF